MQKINILGTVYTLEFITEEEDKELKEHDGYINKYLKTIVISTVDDWDDEKAKEIYQRKVLRHEIIHAFLNELGLHENTVHRSAWAMNEEMVDWFAWMFPKIQKVYEEAECDE